MARILLEEMMAYTNLTVAVTLDAEHVGARVGRAAAFSNSTLGVREWVETGVWARVYDRECSEEPT